jgi:hypothetical protein
MPKAVSGSFGCLKQRSGLRSKLPRIPLRCIQVTGAVVA